MMWVALLVAVVLIGLTMAAVMGRVDGSLVEPTSSSSYVPLPVDPLTEDDLAAIRFDTALRGYRMDQVDDVLDRLVAEIGRLRSLDPARAGVDPARAGSAGEAVSADSGAPTETPSHVAPGPEVDFLPPGRVP
ncbi:MAG: DivIVA domain-containing protein [Dermatophilaceae bacterium]